MAEDDIYGSKKRYEKYISALDRLIKPAKVKPKKGGSRKYYCKNINNIKYYKELHDLFSARDTSYIRRLRVFDSLLFIIHHCEKDIVGCDREEVNRIVAESHKVNKSKCSTQTFLRDIKFLWRMLFPERDEKGRIDDTITPYAVRHLSAKVDKSKEKLKGDRINLTEYNQLMTFFSNDPQMQFYLALSIESLARPQEMSYLRIKDLEMQDSYAKIYVSSHGKEGTKFLQCIDSYPYLIKWYGAHPFKNNKNAFLFIANNKEDNQLTPYNIGKKLKRACQKIGIEKRITPYSLKRNGVTFARLKGESDIDIQHKAGWTSTKQLKTYDLSNAEDSLKKQLAKRGLIQNKEFDQFSQAIKSCICGTINGFAEKICNSCKRLLDKEDIKVQMESNDVMTKILEKLMLKNKEMILEAIKDLKMV